MFGKRGRVSRAKCEHPQTISVRTAGIERVVCESCGHVSFSMVDDLIGSPSRDQFERATEGARIPTG
jgi:hypothetical protein